MNQLCRHILPAGRHCTQPAVRPTLYCRHHQVIKRALAKVEPKPDPYGIYTPLPFVFPEDRAALQINFMLVAQALNDRSINLQMANAFNRIFRSCEINLRKGPLHEMDREKPQKPTQRRNPNEKWLVDDQDSEPPRNPRGEMVQRVVLTPEGEEIAPPREVLEEGEPELIHGKECPCQACAQDYRGAPPEEHHQDCKCETCEETTEPQPATSAQDKSDQDKSDQDKSDQDKIDLSSRPKQSEVEGPAVPQPSHQSNIQPSAITIPQKPQVSNSSSHPDQKVKGCHSERSEESAVPQPSHQTAHPANLSSTEGAKRVCLDGQSRVCLDHQS